MTTLHFHVTLRRTLARPRQPGMAAPASRGDLPRRVRRQRCRQARVCSARSGPAQAPHAGYHGDGLPRRFFEGWYFKVALTPEQGGDAFAFMFSVEDPGLPFSTDRGVGAQVMGPDDTYLCEASLRSTDSTRNFDGDARRLALSHAFSFRSGHRPTSGMDAGYPAALHARLAVSVENGAPDFFSEIETGFVVTAAGEHAGRIRSSATRAERVAAMATTAAGDDGASAASSAEEGEGEEECRWCFKVVPRTTYGPSSSSGPQRSTGGWLSSVPVVFDPHWQILISDGYIESGFIEWRGRTYQLGPENAVYAEKNWGGSFPPKWFWVQCNSGWRRTREGDGCPERIALTAGGGVRLLPVTGAKEEVALIAVHIDGELYEFVPWVGDVRWNVAEWGAWDIESECTLQTGNGGVPRTLHVHVSASTDGEGVVLCAPAENGGLRPMCRDAFRGRVRLRITDVSDGSLVIDAESGEAALEVGGGPWFGRWEARSNMNDVLKAVLNLPLPQSTEEIPFVPGALLPPGL